MAVAPKTFGAVLPTMLYVFAAESDALRTARTTAYRRSISNMRQFSSH